MDNHEDFFTLDQLCGLLPSVVMWGDALTPDIANHIAQAARASQPFVTNVTAAPVVRRLSREEIGDMLNSEHRYSTEMHDFASAVMDAMLEAAPQPPAEPLKDLSDDELRDIDGLFILGRLEFARLAIAADRKLNGG